MKACLVWLHDRLLHHRLEIWGTVVLSVLVCVSIAWLHVLHLNSLARATQGMQSMRLARVELARGMLAVALADGAGSAFQLEQGLAQLRQASQALEKATLGAPDANASAALRESLDHLQGRLAGWQDPSVPREEKAIALNIAYHALDRQAEALDLQVRQDIAALARTLNREFRTALGISGGLLVGVVGLAIMAGHARRHSDSVRRDMARRHEITLRSIGDGVIVTDVNGLVELLNPQAELLTGWTDGEAKG
ncbi:MAG: hypothetical protein LDL30_14540, partial [Desulfovibrio sp.]|nr:hypothetical protein [Desulfovibrio sp.]